MKKIEFFNHGKLKKAIVMACVLFTAFSCDDDMAKAPEPDVEAPEEEMPTGTLMVSDQTISQNAICVNSVTLDKSGWVVIHEDNGSGPVVPAIISVPMYLEAGTTENVMIELDESLTFMVGQKLYPMLHLDSPADEEYTFPENGDSPEVFGFGENNIIVTSFMVSE